MAGKYLLKDKKSNQWVARSGKNANDLFYYFTERRDEALHFSTTAEIEAEKARMKSLGFKTDVFDIVEESCGSKKKTVKESLPKEAVFLYNLNVGDKFTTTLDKKKVFEITGRKGDTTYVKEVATGKDTWFGTPDAFVLPVDESADYQKKRFKEPYYMYKESKKIIKEDAPQKIVIKNAWGVEVKDYKAGDPIPAGAKFKIFNAKDTDKIEAYADSLFESKKIVESEQVPLWTLRKGQKFRVPYDTNIHKAGEQLFKITYVSDHQVDAIDDKGVPYTWENPAQTMVIKEGRIAKGYENLTADERAKHLLSHPTSKYMSDLKSENITERAIRKAVKEMLGKPDKDDPIFIQDVEEGCIKESSFYVKFSLDGKSSKYYTYANGKHGWTDNKSTATKFSTRDEAEASLKKNPFYDAFNMKFFDVVQEEGEAAAVATTTANVANPELPLKMEESYTVIFPTGAGQKLKTIEDVNKFVNGVLHMKDKNAKDVHLTDAMLDKWNKENDIPLVIVKEACSKKKKKVQESLSSKNHKFTPDELKVGKRVIDKIGGKEVHGKITVNHHDLYKDNPYTQDKRGSTVVTIVTDSGRSYDVDANDNGGEFILEDAENLENSFKYQTSVAGGMGSDAENAESAKEHEEETSLIESIIKKAVKKRLTESAGQRLNITLIRKPQNMKEVERDMRKGYGERVKAVVDKSYKLSENEYDKFVYNFMVHTTYLNGQGGVDPDGTVHVIEITAPARKTIYVDPEGYDYARYVGW